MGKYDHDSRMARMAEEIAALQQKLTALRKLRRARYWWFREQERRANDPSYNERKRLAARRWQRALRMRNADRSR